MLNCILLARMPNLLRILVRFRLDKAWMSALDRPQTVVNSPPSTTVCIRVRQNRNSLRWNCYLPKLGPIQYPKRNFADISDDWGLSRTHTPWEESPTWKTEPVTRTRSRYWKRDWGLLDNDTLWRTSNDEILWTVIAIRHSTIKIQDKSVTDMEFRRGENVTCPIRDHVPESYSTIDWLPQTQAWEVPLDRPSS